MEPLGGRTRPPPDVEQALSSMLWTPYDRTSSESSSDETDDVDEPIVLNDCKRRPSNNPDAIYYRRPVSDGCNKWWIPSGDKTTASYNPSSRYSFPLNFNYYHPPVPIPAVTYHSSSMATANRINTTPTASTAVINDNNFMSFMIPPRAEVQTTSMVHSFTDNFVQYQQVITHITL